MTESGLHDIFSLDRIKCNAVLKQAKVERRKGGADRNREGGTESEKEREEEEREGEQEEGEGGREEIPDAGAADQQAPHGHKSHACADVVTGH